MPMPCISNGPAVVVVHVGGEGFVIAAVVEYVVEY